MAEYAQEQEAAEWEAALSLLECEQYEQEQELLRADPAFCEWLESINHETTKDYEHGYHCN